MDHNHRVVGLLYSLRPVDARDARFIDSLRQNSSLNSYINSAKPGVKAQEIWIEEYLRSPGDFYFVVERNSTSERVGLVSLYDVNTQRKIGEWGRWIVPGDPLAVIESALLILRFGFDTLNLSKIVCRTLYGNSQVISFHESLGLKRKRLIMDYVVIRGTSHHAVEHEVVSKNWPEIENRVLAVAERLASRVQGKLVG